MPRMTAKYVAAIATLKKLKKPVAFDQETAYKRLVDAGYMWDSKQGVWFDLGKEPSDKPTQLVYCRVWAAADVVDEAADVVEAAMMAQGCKLVERSNPYPCRPPKQTESRVYLKFMPPMKGA